MDRLEYPCRLRADVVEEHASSTNNSQLAADKVYVFDWELADADSLDKLEVLGTLVSVNHAPG